MNYYTFEIDGEKVGYFEYEDAEGVLYQKACMSIGGDCNEYPFWVRHNGTNILAYKSGDSDYVDLRQGTSAVPSSALMLFLDEFVQTGDFSATVINEGSGEIEGEATFVQVGNIIQVMVNGNPGNHFVVEDGRIIEFGWGGGAVSRYVSTKEEALSGTAWG